MATNKVDLSIHQQALASFQKAQRQQQTAPKAELLDGIVSARPEESQDTYQPSDVAERFEQTSQALAKGRDAVANEPDIRQDRIDEVRERLLNGDYDTSEVREQVAQSLERVMKILDLFVS